MAASCARAGRALLCACALLALVATAAACTDDDQAIVALASKQNKVVSGCTDPLVAGMCNSRKVAAACCVTCEVTQPPVCDADDHEAYVKHVKETAGETINGCADRLVCGTAELRLCCKSCEQTEVGRVPQMPPADDADPVEVYTFAGQSGCAGAANVTMMREDEKFESLLQANASASQVWFAGLSTKGHPDTFMVTALYAGSEGASFGPEVPAGHRLRELTGKRVVVMKYCVGATSIRNHWDPSTPTNMWDRAADDGSAAYLEPLLSDDYPADGKKQQFKFWAYMLRRTKEALAGAGVKFKMMGHFWRQGSADRGLDWKKYGTLSLRLHTAFRTESIDSRQSQGMMQAGHTAANLPIIDIGQPEANLQTGKLYAARLLCHSKVILAADSSKDPGSTCVINPTDPCTDDQYINVDFYNTFGWNDPFPRPLPASANDKKAKWFKDAAPQDGGKPNFHQQYDAAVVTGRSMAQAFLRAFDASVAIPAGFVAEDQYALFPNKRCTGQAPWGPDPEDFCFEDEAVGCATETAAACGSVTAESCLASIDVTTQTGLYTTCPCACSAVATCTAIPKLVDLPVTSTGATSTGATPPPPPPNSTTTTTRLGTTTPSTVCTDNNRAIIALAAKQNVTISGCGDKKVKRACSKFTQLLERCCVTCQGATQGSAGGAAAPKALGGNPFANTNDGSNTATAQSTTGPQGGDSSSCARRSRGRRVIMQAAAVVAAMALC